MITYNTATNPVATQDNEEGEVKKVYVLIKELPYTKKGTEYYLNGERYYPLVDEMKSLLLSIPKHIVENDKDGWFKEKEQPKKEQPVEQDAFVWTNELIEQYQGFRYWYTKENKADCPETEIIEKFKQSKSTPKEEKIEVTVEIGHYYGEIGKQTHVFFTNKKIPVEKAEAVKIAISDVLNGKA